MKTLLAEPVRTANQETLATLRRQNATLHQENTALRADVRTLRAENVALRETVAHQQAVSVELLTGTPEAGTPEAQW